MQTKNHESNAAELTELKQLVGLMYGETFRRLDRTEWRAVAKHRITPMFGPPMMRPDVALVSFQGGSGDRSPSRRSWPDRLKYLDGRFAFGQALRRQFDAAGLGGVLEKRTVAMAACFPEGPANEAGRWMAKTGARAEWREFSTAWVRRLLGAMHPRAVIVFGMKASGALGLEEAWRDVDSDSRGWRTFGRAEIADSAAVYCQRLSQGWSRQAVQRSLAEVRRIVLGE